MYLYNRLSFWKLVLYNYIKRFYDHKIKFHLIHLIKVEFERKVGVNVGMF